MIPEHIPIRNFKEHNDYLKTKLDALMPASEGYRNFFRSIDELNANKSTSIEIGKYVAMVDSFEQADWMRKGGARKLYFEVRLAMLRFCDKADYDDHEVATSESQDLVNQLFETMVEDYRRFGRQEMPGIGYLDVENKIVLPARNETGDMHGSLLVYTIGGYNGSI